MPISYLIVKLCEGRSDSNPNFMASEPLFRVRANVHDHQFCSNRLKCRTFAVLVCRAPKPLVFPSPSQRRATIAHKVIAVIKGALVAVTLSWDREQHAVNKLNRNSNN